MALPLVKNEGQTVGKGTKAAIDELAAKEMFFAVVGPVGSGTSWVAAALEQLVKANIADTDVKVIKASHVIAAHVGNSGSFTSMKALDRAKALQDAGDELRKMDPAAVANLLVAEIKATRDSWENGDQLDATQIRPATRAQPTRVYILDSLKHPAEVALLRSVYREAFCLIGVVCEADVRQSRLRDGKCSGSSGTEIKALMKRDQDAELSWGQKVAATFHLSDFFVDNTPDRFTKDRTENKEWVVNEKLGRLLDILTVSKIIRPLPSESGMFHAAAAQLRSACLSRQVGAALTDAEGNVIATGTNEVPRAGGGVYGGQFDSERGIPVNDHRCAITNKYCSNTRAQDEIMDEVIEAVPALRALEDKAGLKKILEETSLGLLLEFSRAVHAEMDALLSAARIGASTTGAKLFCTTFPCHYCARHLVSAGVDEVQYIEPYPKSRAFALHGDAIEQNLTKWTPPSASGQGKVLFRPFTGVAPRFYSKAFLKDRKLKSGAAGNMEIGKPLWEKGLLKLSYRQIEVLLSEGGES